MMLDEKLEVLKVITVPPEGNVNVCTITKGVRIHPLWIMIVCTTCGANPSSSRERDISQNK